MIEQHFALGGTNGPEPAGPYRHCLVQSHRCCSTSSKLDGLSSVISSVTLKPLLKQTCSCPRLWHHPSMKFTLLFCAVRSQKPYLYIHECCWFLFKAGFVVGWNCTDHKMWWEHVLSVLPLLVLLTGADQFPSFYIPHRAQMTLSTALTTVVLRCKHDTLGQTAIMP